MNGCCFLGDFMCTWRSNKRHYCFKGVRINLTNIILFRRIIDEWLNGMMKIKKSEEKENILRKTFAEVCTQYFVQGEV